MKKITLTILVGILLIGMMSAGAVLVNFVIKDVSFTPPISNETRAEGNVTFLCDGKIKNAYMDEPNLEIDDDIEQFLGARCSGNVSNIVDWTGRKYQENEYGLRSFVDDKLKTDVCNRQELDYNGSDCIEPPTEIGFR